MKPFESDTMTETPLVRFDLDLWGAPGDFIDSVARGASDRGADDAQSYVNPAFAGVVVHVDAGNVARVRAYLRRCDALARRWTRRGSHEVPRRHRGYAST